jgi:hypothetical protein
VTEKVRKIAANAKTAGCLRLGEIGGGPARGQTIFIEKGRIQKGQPCSLATVLIGPA